MKDGPAVGFSLDRKQKPAGSNIAGFFCFIQITVGHHEKAVPKERLLYKQL
jgi:hypothetical protein